MCCARSACTLTTCRFQCSLLLNTKSLPPVLRFSQRPCSSRDWPAAEWCASDTAPATPPLTPPLFPRFGTPLSPHAHLSPHVRPHVSAHPHHHQVPAVPPIRRGDPRGCRRNGHPRFVPGTREGWTAQNTLLTTQCAAAAESVDRNASHSSSPLVNNFRTSSGSRWASPPPSTPAAASPSSSPSLPRSTASRRGGGSPRERSRRDGERIRDPDPDFSRAAGLACLTNLSCGAYRCRIKPTGQGGLILKVTRNASLETVTTLIRCAIAHLVRAPASVRGGAGGNRNRPLILLLLGSAPSLHQE